MPIWQWIRRMTEGSCAASMSNTLMNRNIHGTLRYWFCWRRFLALPGFLSPIAVVSRSRWASTARSARSARFVKACSGSRAGAAQSWLSVLARLSRIVKEKRCLPNASTSTAWRTAGPAIEARERRVTAPTAGTTSWPARERRRQSPARQMRFLGAIARATTPKNCW